MAAVWPITTAGHGRAAARARVVEEMEDEEMGELELMEEGQIGQRRRRCAPRNGRARGPAGGRHVPPLRSKQPDAPLLGTRYDALTFMPAHMLSWQGAAPWPK